MIITSTVSATANLLSHYENKAISILIDIKSLLAVNGGKKIRVNYAICILRKLP